MGGGEVTLTREQTMSADELAACLKRTNQETVELGLRVHLPMTLSTRQKTPRKQTESAAPQTEHVCQFLTQADAALALPRLP